MIYSKTSMVLSYLLLVKSYNDFKKKYFFFIFLKIFFKKRNIPGFYRMFRMFRKFRNIPEHSRNVPECSRIFHRNSI